ncbi:MAG: hypothetical protein CML98_08220 [Rhodobiaceae bacterium]|nr:hypothetical protein [Rhodobiaceae bacterium]|tara:strand:- start:15573 stop:15929 length:357 start_codon:yes stop_codon:yes gene_type:complete
MPLLRSSFFLFLFLVTAISAQPLNNSLEQKILNAIESENYIFIENLIKSKELSPHARINGKPLIIHAAIHDKAEMILLLANYGALLIEPFCDEGKDIMDYAIENKSIHAQAQLIIIRA